MLKTVTVTWRFDFFIVVGTEEAMVVCVLNFHFNISTTSAILTAVWADSVSETFNMEKAAMSKT